MTDLELFDVITNEYQDLDEKSRLGQYLINKYKENPTEDVLNDLKEYFQSWIFVDDVLILDSYLEFVDGHKIPVSKLKQKAMMNFLGRFEDEKELGEYLVDELEILEVPLNVKPFFNYEKFGKEYAKNELNEVDGYFFELS